MEHIFLSVKDPPSLDALFSNVFIHWIKHTNCISRYWEVNFSSCDVVWSSDVDVLKIALTPPEGKEDGENIHTEVEVYKHWAEEESCGQEQVRHDT
jgi:hypothetical protein